MGQYSYISDLPPQVRNVLSVGRQEQWLKAFNTAMWMNPDESTAYSAAWKQILGEAFEGEIPAADLPTIAPPRTVNITINASEEKPFEVPGDPKLEDLLTSVYTTDVVAEKIPDPQERRQYALAVGRYSHGLSERFSSVVNLRGLQFEEDNTSWIHAMPLGTYQHPVYGEIEITPMRIARFASHVNSNVRGQQLDIDYEHKESVQGGKAAGWVLAAEDRMDGLWLKVQWTRPAVESIENDEYKYFSPEFMDEWLDPKTGAVYEDVLFGGALTNRPFFKDLLPVNLSEYIPTLKAEEVITTLKFSKDEANYRLTGDKPYSCTSCVFFLSEGNACRVVEGEIDPNGTSKFYQADYAGLELEEVKQVKQLAEKLGLDPEKATEEDILAAVVKLQEPKTDPEPTQEQKFAELFPEEAARMALLEKRDRENAVEKKLGEWLKKGLAPKLFDEIKEARVGLEGEAAVKFDETVEKILDAGLVDLEELGTGTKPVGDSLQQFEEAVKTRMEEKHVSFAEATRQIAREQPELAKGWQQAAKAIEGR